MISDGPSYASASMNDLSVCSSFAPMAATGEDVIEPAEADVVRPAVAADDPDALLHQRVGEREELLLVGRIELVHARLQNLDARALLGDLRLVLLLASEDVGGEALPNLHGDAPQQLGGELALLVERKAEAEAELGVVFEERVRPRRAAAVGVLRPRRRRQVAAVDRRAAGGVGDDDAVAEERSR